jgi:hypothetical protein
MTRVTGNIWPGALVALFIHKTCLEEREIAFAREVRGWTESDGEDAIPEYNLPI